MNIPLMLKRAKSALMVKMSQITMQVQKLPKSNRIDLSSFWVLPTDQRAEVAQHLIRTGNLILSMIKVEAGLGELVVLEACYAKEARKNTFLARRTAPQGLDERLGRPGRYEVAEELRDIISSITAPYDPLPLTEPEDLEP